MAELGISESEQRWFDRRAGEVRDLQATMRRKNVECVAKIGGILSECRDRLSYHKNGTFIRWCETEFGITSSAAYRSIQVFQLATYYPTVGQYIELGAAYAIAEKTCPEPAKSEVLKLAERGKVVTQSIAKRIIEKHKPSTEPPAPSPFRAEAKEPERATVKQSLTVQEPQVVKQSLTTESHIPDAEKMVRSGELFGDSEELPSPVTIEAEYREESVVSEVEARDAMTAAWTAIKSLPDDSAVKKKCLGLAARIVEMLSTGELDEDDPPVPVPVKITSAQVEEIYKAYPRKVAKQAALTAIRAAVNRGAKPEYLLEATTEYARSREGKEQSFTPHPATWYQQGRYDDDRADWWREDGAARGKPEQKSGAQKLRERMEREGLL